MTIAQQTTAAPGSGGRATGGPAFRYRPEQATCVSRTRRTAGGRLAPRPHDRTPAADHVRRGTTTNTPRRPIHLPEGNPMLVLSETRLTCDEAAARMKKSRRTIERWIREGFDGHYLESATVGLCRFTSVEALDRFVAAMNGEEVAK